MPTNNPATAAAIEPAAIANQVRPGEEMRPGPRLFQQDRLVLVPMTLREANRFVEQFHRHNGTVRGCKFAIGAGYGDGLVGVAIVGRPVNRVLDDGLTAEITRLCVLPEAPRNACSFLYGACWRAWRAMGGGRIVTYTLQTEPGTSLSAAGFKIVGEVGAREWSCKSRPREWQPVYGQKKFRWVKEK